MSTLAPDSPQPLNALELVLVRNIGLLLVRQERELWEAQQAKNQAPDGPEPVAIEPAASSAAAD